jgi:hypothetical protein
MNRMFEAVAEPVTKVPRAPTNSISINSTINKMGSAARDGPNGELDIINTEPLKASFSTET